jgi:hypothetical protein
MPTRSVMVSPPPGGAATSCVNEKKQYAASGRANQSGAASRARAAHGAPRGG